MQRYLRADTLRLHEATAKFLFTSRLLDTQLAKAANGAISCPASLLLSSRDRIIHNEATRNLLMRLAGRGLEVREFSGAHTLEFEADPAAFYQGLAETLIRRENLAR
jgi:alpha-beta hydrolase superfamily lysophospholipase